MKPSEILEYFQKRQAGIIEEIREIVDIESPSYDVEQNGRMVEWLSGRIRQISPDFKIEKTNAEGYGQHVTVRAFPSAAKSILLLGHIDTVHPVGTCESNPTRIEDGKLYGCGVFDMKAGIILMLEALRFFRETGTRPSRPIRILLSCDEEVGSMSGRELVESAAREADYCLVFEPSLDGRVKTGRKGTGMFTVKTWGKPAHAGLEPEKGASAILELARQIEKLHALNDPAAGTTVNVCTIRGGTTTNVIPEHAECSVDVRFTSAGEAERIGNAISGLQAVDERVKILVTGGVNRPPLERSEAVGELFNRARDLAAEFGYELGETQVGGASDGNFVAACGVPVLDGLGIAGDGAHRMDEHILVDDVPKRATLVTSLLLNL